MNPNQEEESDVTAVVEVQGEVREVMERNTTDQIAREGALQDPMDMKKGQGRGQVVLEESHQDRKGKWMVQEKAQEQVLERGMEMVQMIQ